MEGDRIQEIDASLLQKEDIFFVRAGEMIPADGQIISGEGYVNESSLTGEATRVYKQKDTLVYAGTILEIGTLSVEVSQGNEDTVFAKIIAFVEEAQTKKSALERLLDRFSKGYTPFVLLLSVFVAIGTRDIAFAITLLVLACPGALVIGVPLAMVAGIGRAAKQGILLKGGDDVFRLAKTSLFVFDKTGTITEGKPRVVDVRYLTSEKEQCLESVAITENLASHPLAEALQTYITSQHIAFSSLWPKGTVWKGKGVEATIQTNTYWVGSQRLMLEQGIIIDEDSIRTIERWKRSGSSIVYVAKNQVLEAIFAIQDSIKPSTRKMFAQFRKSKKLRFALLTGDHQQSAENVAKVLQIDQIGYDLLPHEKAEQVIEWQNQGHLVTFIGDGINDSPALAIADVGIAVGGSTDIAMETSGVVFAPNTKSSVYDAYKIARFIRQVSHQNVVLSLLTVLLLAVGLFTGHIAMASGMFLHEVSILIVSLNATRLLLQKKEKGGDHTCKK